MSESDDALLRLGLALYHETRVNGLAYYNVQELIFEHIAERTSPQIFARLFHKEGRQFWGKEEELAKRLSHAGIAEHFIKPNPANDFVKEHFVKLTSFGKGIYDLAYSQSAADQSSIEGISLEDALLVLRDERRTAEFVNDLQNLDGELNKLELSNFQRSAVNSYLQMMVVLCSMPDPDGKLFWMILNRLNQFAGVASLVVALIALRLG